MARGFTIVELMVSIVIAALLVGLALPSFRELTIRSNVTELNNQLVLALQTARSEAVRRGTWVEVASQNGNNWSVNGWQVIADTNFDHNFDGTDATVTTTGPAPANYKVCTKASGGSDARVIFGPSGILMLSTKFDINVNRPDGKSSMVQHITISASGEVKTVRGDPTGAPTSC